MQEIDFFYDFFTEKIISIQFNSLHFSYVIQKKSRNYVDFKYLKCKKKKKKTIFLLIYSRISVEKHSFFSSSLKMHFNSIDYFLFKCSDTN